MWSDSSIPVVHRGTPSVSLAAIWQVQADSSYDIHLKANLPGMHVAIRTWKGCGTLISDSSANYSLTSDTLLLMPWKRIKRYYCEGDCWNFWWFKFSFVGDLPLPLCEVINLPDATREIREFKDWFARLRDGSPHSQVLVSSQFSLRLHRWGDQCQGKIFSPNRHQGAVYRVIQAMNTNLSGTFSVPEMSRIACLSERRFRQVFQQMTGKSPKNFYNELRLQMGAQSLLLSSFTVSQIADQLGFSSPFHFSKMFCRRFGIPPIRYRNTKFLPRDKSG